MQAKQKILIIEDDAGVRELVRTRLNMAGYDVHTARTGTEGLRRLFELRPAGMVLDINLPGLDGFAILNARRADPLVQRTAVLVLSARHAGEDVRRAIALGAKDFLTKPFNETQLVTRIARILRPPLAAVPAENDVYL